MKCIQKVPFDVPFCVWATKLSALKCIVTDSYHKIERDASSVLAYKGGQCEMRLLASLGILSLNLESFGCPNVGELIDHPVWLETCGNYISNEAYRHCPKVEVEAYAQCLENVFSEQ